ncbi:MAG: DUF192 domain-containing protein [Mesonia hippocampi]|uniref:DUF192 domain-containing protein n=1 Tax=Mesonia hippocampi TaxID=1628250 RepID=A0A840ENR6_9FLAO|nr:DUF192 domain-containing protein [Mesonia hippocampi]MBB4120019.1 hypothetical protein [Mesonia hippocampi]
MKTQHLIKFSLIGLLGILIISCKEEAKQQRIETPEVSFTKEGELHFTKATGDTIATIEIEFAKTDYEQQTGLMYRKSMKANRGMLFVYTNEQPRPYFYMKDTYINLDLIYINAKGELVDFNENAQAFDETTLSSNKPAQYVLEVNAGMVKKWGLNLGDKASFTEL